VNRTLSFDGRMHCRIHTDVSLAHLAGVDGLVCVVCRTQRAVQLEAVLGAGNDFDYPMEFGRVLHYVAEHRETGA
jgi:CRISPR/Cas system-associated exonuclease Cas4 (RecB family)